MGCDSEVARHRKCDSGLYVSFNYNIVSILNSQITRESFGFSSRCATSLPSLPRSDAI